MPETSVHEKSTSLLVTSIPAQMNTSKEISVFRGASVTLFLPPLEKHTSIEMRSIIISITNIEYCKVFKYY